jgi:hypothetical protein
MAPGLQRQHEIQTRTELKMDIFPTSRRFIEKLVISYLFQLIVIKLSVSKAVRFKCSKNNDKSDVILFC